MGEPDLVRLTKPNVEECAFCGRNDDRPAQYGEKYKSRRYTLHEKCLFTAEVQVSVGIDRNNIAHYLPLTIQRTLSRSAAVRCVYCEKEGAASRCRTCQIAYHLPCGYEAGAISLYQEGHRTYCREHRPQQKIAMDAIHEALASGAQCSICIDNVRYDDDFENKYMWAACCKKNFYHRHCVEEMAHSMGSQFKCAMCSNKAVFQTWMAQNGIWIRARLASYETEPYLYRAPNLVRAQAQNQVLAPNPVANPPVVRRHIPIQRICEIPVCHARQGRRYNSHGSPWEIIMCYQCARSGAHVHCSEIGFGNRFWCCRRCLLYYRGGIEVVQLD